MSCNQSANSCTVSSFRCNLVPSTEEEPVTSGGICLGAEGLGTSGSRDNVNFKLKEHFLTF